MQALISRQRIRFTLNIYIYWRCREC
jgi:hypothetical protein